MASLSKALRGREFSKEHRKNLSKALKKQWREGKRKPVFSGRKHTEEAKRKMSLAKQGYIPWNKGKIGIYSEETKRKISKANKGKHNSPNTEYKKGMVSTFKGKKHTEDAKKKLSEAHKGMKKPWAGKYKRTKKYRENMSKKVAKGKEHWNWKGGITSLKNQIRNHYKYRQWRSDVFTRDDFTCQKCGDRGCYLEADHYPKGFAEIFDEYKIKTLEGALNCEEFWNINNGRTLCKRCH